MQEHVIHISDDFIEIDTRSIDVRNRLTLSELSNYKRAQIYKNDAGEILIRPIVEIPASELWLYQNKEALKAVQEGLEDARDGKISKLEFDIDDDELITKCADKPRPKKRK